MGRGEAGRPVTLDADDRDGIAQFGLALRTAGYDVEHMRRMLHAEGDNLTPRPSEVPLVLRLLPKDDPLATLIRLFLLRTAVAGAAARRAFGKLTVERAIRLGIVRRSGGQIAPAVRIVPAGSLLFACDLAPEGTPDLAPDHVMGVSSSSVFLASLTVRAEVDRALDIGTGCGIQSVLAAQHARTVVACDINPRALNFTAFNAALNDVSNIECRQGSFFEPVAGESFDLIVSNPPFVISPENAITFRDSGMRGDAVSRMVVREAAAHLREGGEAFSLISWGIGADQAWPDPLRPWAAGLGCDVWFLQHSAEDPLGYAAAWNMPLQAGGGERYTSALDRWVANLRKLGFAQVGYGAAILRKRSAATNWVRLDDLRGQRTPSSGDVVARLIAAQDYLSSLASDRALLDARLTLNPAHRLDQVLRCRDGTFVVEAAALRLEDGFRFESEVDAFSADLLSRLDGRRTLREAVALTAARFGSDAVPASEFEAGAIPVLRRMIALGFVRLPD